jgi:uncharacterized protein involved in type VI secretion and phage assembly
MKRIDGVAVGLVSEVDAKLGRVKVKFPWMDPPQASYWAPIASILSGKKRGARFMPELEDEALVAFDRGEFDHPYVIGFLWNGTDEAPDDEKSNRIMVTPGGHELRFEDKDGDRRVVVKTAGGHTLSLDDKAKSVMLKSKKEHKLEILDDDGTVTLQTKDGGKVTLDNQPGKAVVEASQNKITLGPEGITIEVTAGTLNVKSTTMTNIEAQGALTVKSTAAATIQSSASMTIMSGGALAVTATGAVNVTAGGLINVPGSLLNVTAPMAIFSGVLQATTVIATSVVASSYTSGAGNIW